MSYAEIGRLTLDQIKIEFGYDDKGFAYKIKPAKEQIGDLMDELCRRRGLSFDDLRTLPAASIAAMILAEGLARRADPVETGQSVLAYLAMRGFSE